MNWRNASIVAFDTETTGLAAHDGDRVIEFAAVKLHLDEHGDVSSVETVDLLFNPGFPIPRQVVDLTGINDDDVADAPAFDEHAGKVASLLDDAIVVAHNLPFDRGFLTMELRKAGLDWPSPLAELDTFDLSLRFFPHAASHKLGDLCARVSVVLDGAHRATNDAEACGRAFAELARRYDAPSELQAMLDWADALGLPPDDPYLAVDPRMGVVFAGGPHRGEAVERHTSHLQWMTMARIRHQGAWHFRFPESVRSWADRYLRVRASGRARQNPRSFGPSDWGIDSCALPVVGQA